MRSLPSPRRRSGVAGLVLVAAVLAVGSFVHEARGDAKTEADVKKIESDAMDVDFLSLNYKDARKKLEGAIKKCGSDKCSAELRGQLHRDLGVVLVNMKDGGAQGEFETALSIDPSGQLAKDFLADASVKAAWDAAKKKSGGTTTTTTTTTGTTSSGNTDVEGNLGIRYSTGPVGYVFPVVVSVPDGLDVSSVKVSYKGAGAEKYHVLDARQVGGAWVATIPCEDVGYVGDIKVYVKAYDADKSEIEHYGTVKKPAVITIVDKMPEAEESPAMPDGAEPEKCVEKGACPPGFPCEGTAAKKPQGSGCESDDECETGLSCVDNENGSKWCYDVGDASSTGGKKTEAKGSRFWLGVDGQIDFLLIGQQDDICSQTTWACVKGGRDVGTSIGNGIPTEPAHPDQNIPGGGGKTAGGPALGTIRVFVSADYFLTPHISGGLRLGWAFNGNSSSTAKFMPFHSEVRAQYWFGDSPMVSPTGIKPYALLGGGYAEYDAAVPNIVVIPHNASDADDPACATDGTPCRLSGVKAYRLAGDGFVEAGAGAWWMLTPKIALNGALKFLFPLPTFSLGISPELGLNIAL